MDAIARRSVLRASPDIPSAEIDRARQTPVESTCKFIRAKQPSLVELMGMRLFKQWSFGRVMFESEDAYLKAVFIVTDWGRFSNLLDEIVSVLTNV